MTEAEFQETIVDLLRALGYGHMHVRRSIGKGRRWTTATNVPWPDLTIWGHGRFMVRELKVADRWQPGQREVLDQLRWAGVDVGVWWPSDLDDGRILAELRWRK